MPEVAVVHPWLPQYRRRFFADLVARLGADGIRLTVWHGSPPPEVRARQDAVAPGRAGLLPTRHLAFAGRTLTVKRLPEEVRTADLVVVEQAIRNLETYPLLLGRRHRVAFWGHGRTYTKRPSAPEEWVKRHLTARGAWFFAYTEGGARVVARQGFDPDRITVVHNTFDTRELAAAADRVSPDDTARTAADLGIDPASTCLFVGGLDATKRVTFLLAAAASIRRALPGFRLIVAGDGDQRPLIEATAREVDWLRYVGRAGAAEKAALAAVSRALLLPGRVGLASVDSFVLGRPIVTTSWPWHAPEFEYLEPGRTAVVTADDVEDYARRVVELLTDPARLAELSANCRAAAGRHTMDRMVAAFSTGVRSALQRG